MNGANLSGADLSEATLYGAKNYADNHSFFQETVRQQKVETFVTDEWAAIGQIIVHTLCWDSIHKRFEKEAKSIFEKLETVKFGEFLKRFEETGK
jgi:hypothetical protein